VRIKEHGTFSSGQAELTPNFRPVLRIIQDVLKSTDGRIVVEGHTDDVPISTARFRSNWALSSARAVSVAHALFGDDELDQGRFTIAGYADTRPLVSNETEAGRARNRRVEIVINQGLSEDVKQELEVLRSENPAVYNRVREELIRRFELAPEEVF
jgi:chemotaxis protein MotB